MVCCRHREINSVYVDNKGKRNYVVYWVDGDTIHPIDQCGGRPLENGTFAVLRTQTRLLFFFFFKVSLNFAHPHGIGYT